MQAGFASVEFTPPVGTRKIGWLKDIVSTEVLDPVQAHAVVLADAADRRIAMASLDCLSVRWTQAQQIRRLARERCGLAEDCVMVAATHNHAGPAVNSAGLVARDESAARRMIDAAVEALARACQSLVPAEAAPAWMFELEVSHNRRVVMRDGTARTHGSFDDPQALYVEGPIDPELFVLAVRTPAGEPLGAVVNFACHPTHHGPSGAISAGYPGALARSLAQVGWPACVFLNGACGNLHDADPARGGRGSTPQDIGQRLADGVLRALQNAQWRSELPLAGSRRTIELPYRPVTDEQVRGTAPGAQRFVDPTIYDRLMPSLLERIRARGKQPAEVQVLRAGEFAFAGIPAELFVQFGLRIKVQSHPVHALVVGHANGMVGYVPHAEAFARGGYETTFAPSSRMAPEAGDLLADCAVELIRAGAGG